MKPSVCAQIIFDGLLKTRGRGLGKKVLHKLLSKLRAFILRLGDPLIKHRFGRAEILIPFSSQVPFYMADFPQYSTNIGRVAALVKRKYPGLTLVDIGANIGDTAILARHQADIPVLCIEGEDLFFSILQANINSFGGKLDAVHCFVSDCQGDMKASIDTHRGTARLVEDQAGTVRAQTLEEILAARPLFAASKMIKVDTDGFDCRILQGNLPFLAKTKPVIFFEYDPYAFAKWQDDGFKIFERLRSIGYVQALIYENNGDYLLTADLSDERLLQDVHCFYSGRHEGRYCDICVFHQEDSELCSTVREAELAFFSQLRR